MRLLITALMVFINFILQTTLLQMFAIRGVLPNTALIIAVSYALLRGSREGAFVGIGAGLLQDIFFGGTLGAYALLYAVLAVLFGRSQRDFYRENYLLPVLFCSIAACLCEGAVYIVGFVFQGMGNLLYFLFQVMLPVMVYTAVITVPIYRILFGVNDWLELKEKYKYRLF